MAVLLKKLLLMLTMLCDGKRQKQENTIYCIHENHITTTCGVLNLIQIKYGMLFFRYLNKRLKGIKNSMPQFILVHGWGSGPDFWDELIPHLVPWPVKTVDLGFTGPEKTAIEMDNASVFITHSLGTMWALKNRFPRIKALIAINGFYCFRHFICRRTLEAMQMRLKRNPIPQMDKFWESCGIGPGNPMGLDLQKLQEGLEWLISWNFSKELNALAAPVLSLAGQADPILAPDLMKKQWSGFSLRMVRDGGHALPQTHPVWCADHIREFLHGISMER